MTKWGSMMVPALAVAALAWTGIAGATDPADPANDAKAAEWRRATMPLARELATSADPRRQLVGAHLLLSPYPFDAGPRNKAAIESVRAEAQAIFARVRAGSSDFMVLWLAATDCPFGGTLCDRDGAIDALLRLEPNNAAPWFLALDRALARRDRAAVDEALDGIVAAGQYRQHVAMQLRTWIDAYETFGDRPGGWPNSMVEDDGAPAALADDPADRRAFHGLLGFSVGLFKGWPRMLALQDACDKAAVQDATRLVRCRGAARALRDADVSMVATVANGALFRLAGDDAAMRGDAERAHRLHQWRMEAAAAVLGDPFGADGAFDARGARALLDAWRTHDLERDVFDALLAHAGADGGPPADWRPTHTLAERAAQR